MWDYKNAERKIRSEFQATKKKNGIWGRDSLDY